MSAMVHEMEVQDAEMIPTEQAQVPNFPAISAVDAMVSHLPRISILHDTVDRISADLALQLISRMFFDQLIDYLLVYSFEYSRVTIRVYPLSSYE